MTSAVMIALAIVLAAEFVVVVQMRETLAVARAKIEAIELTQKSNAATIQEVTRSAASINKRLEYILGIENSKESEEK